MELVDALDQTFGHAHKVIAGVRPDQYGDKTPCAEWTVRDLLAHMVGVVSHMAAATAGEPSPGTGGFELGADPAAHSADAGEGQTVDHQVSRARGRPPAEEGEGQEALTLSAGPSPRP